MRLIFLGAPGAGKGTQAAVVSERYGIPVVSTGNIISEAIRKGTEEGLLAKGYVESGQLVPDGVVIGIIRRRLSEEDCEKGFILDGFPRTVPQAEALERMGVQIDAVIALEVKDETIIARMSGRRVCSRCGSAYHVTDNPEKVAGVCDRCSGELVQRPDDRPDTVVERLRVYHAKTEPLKEFYALRGKLVTVEGRERVEDTTAATLYAIEKLCKAR